MGICADPVEAMRNMLANCIWFQQWAGVAEEANPVDAAKAKTFVDGLDGPALTVESMTAEQLTAARPYALVYAAENESFRLRRDASPNCWSLNGKMVVVLSKSYEATISPTEYWTQLSSEIEKIVWSGDDNNPGLCEMADTPGYLGIQEIVIEFFGRTPFDQQNDYGDAFDVVLMIDWGR